MYEGYLQNILWLELALYGSVCDFEPLVLHGVSARIFCHSCRGGLLSPESVFSTSGRRFGPGTFLV